ncbi:MAG: hypothetical protein ACXVEE_26500 [Polyangiales bacterium]
MTVRQVLGMLAGGVAVFVACASQDAMQPAADGGVISDAAAAEPQVDDVDCSIVVDGSYYAEKTYPGRSQDSLALGAVTMCGDGASTPPPGYTCRTLPSKWVKAGAVSVYCGSSPGLKARFIMPSQ